MATLDQYGDSLLPNLRKSRSLETEKTVSANGTAFLPTRRYASAGISCRRVWGCVCLCNHVLIETTEQVELIFGIHVFLDPCYTVFKKTSLSPKIRVLSSGILFQTLDFRKICHGTPTVSECDINSDGGRCGVDSTWGDSRHGKCGLQSTMIAGCWLHTASSATVDWREAPSRGSIGVSWYSCGKVSLWRKKFIDHKRITCDRLARVLHNCMKYCIGEGL